MGYIVCNMCIKSVLDQRILVLSVGGLRTWLQNTTIHPSNLRKEQRLDTLDPKIWQVFYALILHGGVDFDDLDSELDPTYTNYIQEHVVHLYNLIVLYFLLSKSPKPLKWKKYPQIKISLGEVHFYLIIFCQQTPMYCCFLGAFKNGNVK